MIGKLNVLIEEKVNSINAKQPNKSIKNETHADSPGVVIAQEINREFVFVPNFILTPLSGSENEIKTNNSVCENATAKSVVVIVLSHYQHVELRYVQIYTKMT